MTSGHSNPPSDHEDLISSEDDNRSELPSSAMQEGRQILNQSMRSKQSIFKDDDDTQSSRILVKKASMNLRASMPVITPS